MWVGERENSLKMEYLFIMTTNQLKGFEFKYKRQTKIIHIYEYLKNKIYMIV